MKFGIASKVVAVFSSLVIVAAVAMSLAVTRAGSELLMDAAVSHLRHGASIAGVQLSGMIDAVSKDTLFLVRTKTVQRVASGIDEKRELAEILSAILESRPWYFQARLIGGDGKELVRVERKGETIARTPEPELQVKAHRRYVEETLKLAASGFYLSDIDLYRVQDRISEPHTPILRGARPVYKEDGSPFGLVVINVNLGPVFTAARSLIEKGASLYVTNSRGDYLYHPDSARTFGFEFGKPQLIQADVPDVARVLDGSMPHLVTEHTAELFGSEGLSYFERVTLGAAGAGQDLVLGVSTPRSTVVGHVEDIRKKAAGFTLIFAVVAVVIAFAATHVLTRPLGQLSRSVAQLLRDHKPGDLPVARNDEVGQLAREFQRLGAELQRLKNL